MHLELNNTYVIKKKGQNQLPLKISKFKNLTNAQNGPKITKKLITSLEKKKLTINIIDKTLI